MRIDSNGGENVITNGRSGATQGLGFSSLADRRTQSAGRDADMVNVSAASNLLAIAKQMAPPVDRQAKLATLAVQLRTGEYQVDPEDVSHALVEDHLQQ